MSGAFGFNYLRAAYSVARITC